MDQVRGPCIMLTAVLACSGRTDVPASVIHGLRVTSRKGCPIQPTSVVKHDVLPVEHKAVAQELQHDQPAQCLCLLSALALRYQG